MGGAKYRHAQLDAVYAELPDIDCAGRCWRQCTAIRMSPAEHVRVAEAGHPIPSRSFENAVPGQRCEALSQDRRCLVYDVRPLICRLYGAAEGLRCSYGCVPERVLTRSEVAGYLTRIAAISGQLRPTA